MKSYSRNRYAIDLDDLRLEHQQAKKAQETKKGFFGVDLNNEKSPLYVIQQVKGLLFLCSTKFDDPPCSWVTIHKDDFWTLV
jgi:peptide methionine sulfoxide reductase MsrB